MTANQWMIRINATNLCSVEVHGIEWNEMELVSLFISFHIHYRLNLIIPLTHLCEQKLRNREKKLLNLLEH